MRGIVQPALCTATCPLGHRGRHPGIEPRQENIIHFSRLPCRRALEVALAACTNALDSEVYDLELQAYPAIGTHLGCCQPGLLCLHAKPLCHRSAPQQA